MTVPKKIEPIQCGLIFGIAGGATFAISATYFNYLRDGSYSWIGLVGGIAWFITSMAISLYASKNSKNK